MKSVIEYIPNFIEKEYFDILLNEIEWMEQKLYIYGKTIIPKRKTTIYGDSSKTYYYSGQKRELLNMTKSLQEINDKLKEKYNVEFNCVLCNYYEDGEAYIGYHSDNEKDIDQTKPIISLSFGGERDFCIKDNETKKVIKYKLENKSLLYMGKNTQKYYQHSLPKRKKSEPRINLTFRVLL